MAKKAKKTRPASGASGGGSDSRAASGPVSPTDVGYMEELARLMAANDLNTVDVRDGDRRVILKRGQAVVSVAGFPAGAPGYSGAPVALSAPAAQPAGGAAPSSQSAAGATGSAASEESRFVP